jgi:hypothetical protein
MPIRKIPSRPITTPTIWRREVAVLKKIPATMTVKIGMALFIIPVREELIHCWAMGNSVSGKAIHVMANKTIFGQSDRSTGFRWNGSNQSVTHPKATRNQVIIPGEKASNPISIKKNDAPQIPAAPQSNAQSNGWNGVNPVSLIGMDEVTPQS